MLFAPLGDLRFDRLRQKLLRSTAKNLVQGSLRPWQTNRRCGNFLHGGVLLVKKGTW
jgi:hypothetical protein